MVNDIYDKFNEQSKVHSEGEDEQKDIWNKPSLRSMQTIVKIPSPKKKETPF